MRVDVALTPSEFAGASLAGGAALVIDVLRASTSVVAACAAGCRQVMPRSKFTQNLAAILSSAKWPA